VKLPELKIDGNLLTKITVYHLEFLSSLYIKAYAKNKLNYEKTIWFLREIAHLLILTYPNKELSEIEQGLIHLTKLAEEEAIKQKECS